MNKHLKLFTNHTAYEAAKNNIDKPNVVMCLNENEVHYNPVLDPFELSALIKVTSGDAAYIAVNVANNEGQIMCANNSPMLFNASKKYKNPGPPFDWSAEKAENAISQNYGVVITDWLAQNISLQENMIIPDSEKYILIE